MLGGNSGQFQDVVGSVELLGPVVHFLHGLDGLWEEFVVVLFALIRSFYLALKVEGLEKHWESY